MAGNYFAPLAAPEVRNALVDFSPVNNALDTNALNGFRQQQAGLEQQQSNRAQQQLDAQGAERTYQHGRDAKQDALVAVQTFGKQATAVDNLQGPARAAAWSSILSRHGTDGLTPEELDPVTGPKLMAAQAGQFVDPLERQTKEAQLGLIRAQTTGATQKNTLNEAIAGLITGGGSSSAPAGTAGPGATPPSNALAAPIPRIQPQSFNGQPTMPGVQLTSDTSTIPSGPPPVAAQQPDMVQTPLGPMTPQRARSAGFALSLAGKDSAGKALMDAGSASLGKAGEGQNDKEELGATGQLATLNAIKASADPKFLNIPNRVGYAWNALKDKFGALDPKSKADLGAYTQFRQNAWHNLNRVLKDLSGTAVTENEMQRQLLDLPNPGKGIGDGDSPTEFDAKLKNSIAFQTSAIARARWLRTKGFTGKPWEAGVSVEDMPAIINQRGAEIEQEFRQSHPNATPMQLQQATTREIKQEFGI